MQNARNIKWIVDITSSNTDRNGNRYHIARYTRVSDGKGKTFHVNAESNAESVAQELAGGNWPGVHTTRQSVPVREYQRLVRFYEPDYLNDCNKPEAAKRIRAALRKV